MMTMGFVVKDWFNGGLMGRVSLLPSKASDSDAQVNYVPCTKSRLELAHIMALRRPLTTLYHPASTGLEETRKHVRVGFGKVRVELTNIAIWVAMFGKVALSFLKDCGQSSRVVNVSVQAVRTLKPVSSTVGSANLLRSNSALTLIALALHSCLFTAQSSSFVRKRL